jgi:hypothetical protein
MSSDTKAALILSAIFICEGAWLALNVAASPSVFLRFCGFGNSAGFAAWSLALAVALGFTTYTARLHSVRTNLFRLSGLKLIAIGMSICAGFCEEVIFRKMPMDYVARVGLAIVWQIVVSALVFGAAHAIWGLFRGSFIAAFSAMFATGSLGLLLAIVYVIGGRNLAPCIVSHLLINLLAEPGLVLAAARGEMAS